jgi:transcriptional regulator with PAS, ATPase and Fis domain
MSLIKKYLGRNLHQMTLEYLSAEDADTVASFLLNDENGRTVVQERAAGNPLFLEEYSRNTAISAVPAVIRNALSQMIVKLPNHTIDIAQILSIFRHPIDATVLVGMTELRGNDLRECLDFLHRIGLADAEKLAIHYPDARNLLESGIPRFRRIKLHATAFRCLRDQRYDSTVLAMHAFNGGLWEDAANLYRQLAREVYDRKDRASAARYFEQVSKCRLKDPNIQPLEPLDSVKHALGNAFLGNKTAARRILQELMHSEAVHEDAEVQSAAYTALASPLLEDSALERVRLLKLAIECLPPGSAQLTRRYRLLTLAFLSAGDTANAETALNKAATYCMSSEDAQQLSDIRASLFMNQGCFKEAAACLLAQEFSWTSPAAVPNNLAVCIEHLGDIKRAREVQLSALAEAESADSLFMKILSLGNLGSMETKLGNIAEAEKSFSSAFIRLKQLHSREGRISRKLGIVHADAALHFLQRGDFRAARQCIEEADFDRNGLFPIETLAIMHARCYLEAAVGLQDRALKTLEQARHLPLRGDFFEIERLLVEFRIMGPSQLLRDRLREAVSICQRLGTLYQECQVLLGLARTFLFFGQIFESNRAARRARRIATTNSYRLLEAEAFLLVGLSSIRFTETEFFLTKCLTESTTLGLTPLSSECAFRMGSWRWSLGDSAGAAEYLSKSVSMTARLSESLTGSYRRKYLEMPDHRAARNLLATTSQRAIIRRTKLSRQFEKDDSLFVKLYRLVAAMAASVDVESATASLLKTLKQSVEYPVIVVFGSGGKMMFHSLRDNISEQTKQQIVNTAALAGEQTYISGTGTSQARRTAVWVPLRSFAQPGGIYMECPRGQNAPDEREIEFLTIVGILAGAALDRAISKTITTMTSASALHGIVGTSKQIAVVHEQIDLAAENDANVLIEGESGTGKELIARAVHKQSARADGPFIPIDCGALPDELIEAELFGAKKGAYTGALSDRTGLFEAANRGTIFLDEISNLGLAAQAKLLRVLQDREVRKIGSTAGKVVDVRLIAATNCNLEKLVHQGTFRKDLLYRLKVLYIAVPPLRDRKADIPVLATAFLERLNMANQTNKFLGPAVMQRLLASDYPGNIRELQNAVERAFYSTRGAAITHVDFLEDSLSISAASTDTESWFKDLTEGRQNFWQAVHDPYKRRDISRERVVALVDYGLRVSQGNYRSMASKFQIPKNQYRKFMDFLRRSNCLLDFRPYRRISE